MGVGDVGQVRGPRDKRALAWKLAAHSPAKTLRVLGSSSEKLNSQLNVSTILEMADDAE